MKKLVLFTLMLFVLFCGTNAFAYSIPFEDAAGNRVFDIEIVEGGGADSEQTIITITNSGPADISNISFYGDSGLVSLIRFEEELTESQVIFEDRGTVGNTDSAVHNFSYKTSNKHGKFMLETGESMVFMVDQAYNAVVTAGGLSEIIARGGTDDDGQVEVYTGAIIATPTPEPATMLLLGAGLIGIAGMGRRKLFKKK